MGYFYTEYNKAKEQFEAMVAELEMPKSFITELYEKSFNISWQNQLMDLLKIMKESEYSAFAGVKRAEEAVMILQGFSNYADNRKKLINDATEVFLFCEKTQKLNQFVKQNVFLGNEYLRMEYPNSFADAKKYLEDAPLFSKYYTNDAIRCIWKSFIGSLNKEELPRLLEYITPPLEVINELELTGEQRYINNLLFVKEKLGCELPNIEHINTRLKGVTFTNEDKSERQEYLKQLKDIFKKTPQEITIERWEYKGEPAAKVLWKGCEIGAVPAELMKTFTEKYGDNFNLSGEIVNVSGGDSFNYGCEIKLHVFAEQKSNIKISEFFKKKQAEEIKEDTPEDKDERPDDKTEPDDTVEELDFT